jgi:hypothetical protein
MFDGNEYLVNERIMHRLSPLWENARTTPNRRQPVENRRDPMRGRCGTGRRSGDCTSTCQCYEVYPLEGSEKDDLGALTYTYEGQWADGGRP